MQVARLMAQQICKKKNKKTLLSIENTQRKRERERGKEVENIVGNIFLRCICVYLCDLACCIRKSLSVAGPVGSTYVR